MMNNKITIAIPTLNRIANLKESLRVLVPQLDENCRLLIIDNNSDKPVQDEITDVIPSNRLFDFEIIRNVHNIDGNPNLARCFEFGGTSWLFILSDSKILTNDAVKILRRNMLQFPEAVLINYYYPCKLHSPRYELNITKGRLSFIKGMGSFGNIILAGNSIINMQKIKSMEDCYHYVYTFMPQFATPLINMNDNSVCVLSPEKIIESIAPLSEAYMKTRRSYIDYLVGSSTLLDLPLSHAERVELSKKMIGVDVRSQPYISFFKSILLMSIEPGRLREAQYYFHRVCSTWYYYHRSIITRIKLFGTYILLRLPFITRMLIGFNKKFIKTRIQK